MKSKFKILLFIFILFLVSIYFSANIRTGALGVSSGGIFTVKEIYWSVSNFFSQYFNTTAEITRLRKANERLAKYEMLYLALKSDYADLLGMKNSILITDTKTLPVRINGYEALGVKSRFWASLDINFTHPLGLAANGAAVGVLTLKENRPFAISLEDKSAAISAKVGNQQAIVRGDGSRVWVDFLEDFAQLNIGAQVLTSGRDGIFPAGVYIGKVASVEQKSGYKRALLSDCAKMLPYRYVQALQVQN